MVRGEPRRRARQLAVRVGVARDEEVEPPVAVHVGDGRPGVPAEGAETGLPGALGERPVALVPEERVEGVAPGVVAGGRDVEIRRAVPVEIGRDAAAAAHREPGPRPTVTSSKRPPRLRKRRLVGSPPRASKPGMSRLGVGVDDVEVEPAVPVVVEPADAAAHHRRLVAREAEAERVVAEVEADLVGDVGERERRAARDRRRRLRARRAPPRAGTARPARRARTSVPASAARCAPHLARRAALVGRRPGTPRRAPRRSSAALGRRPARAGAARARARTRERRSPARAQSSIVRPEPGEPAPRRRRLRPRSVARAKRLVRLLERGDERGRDRAAHAPRRWAGGPGSRRRRPQAAFTAAGAGAA